MKRLLTWAGSAGVAVAAWAASTPANDKPAAPAIISQPSALSARAQHHAALAVTRAGARLVAVGEAGVVLLSDDSGKSWRQARVPTSVALTAVHFPEPSQGWAVGHFGVVLHSDDGGASWTRQLDGTRAAALLLQAARARGDAKAMAGAQRLVADGPDKPFLDVHFVDARRGLVVGAYGLMLRTADGGRSWQPVPTEVANPRGLHVYGIARRHDALVLAGEQGLLMRARIDGSEPNALPSPYAGSFFGIAGARGGDLVAYGLRGNAFASSDGGTSWRKLELGTSVALSAATVLTDGRLALASQAGEIWVSSAAGGREFVRVAVAQPVPLAGIAQAGASGALVGASLRGMLQLDVKSL